jgi:hypothetical protein
LHQFTSCKMQHALDLLPSTDLLAQPTEREQARHNFVPHRTIQCENDVRLGFRL